MLMVVEFSAQNIEAKAEVAYFCSNGIVNQNLALSDVVAVVEESCEDAPTETEILVVTLQDASESGTLDIVLEVHPYRVFCIVKEHSLLRLAVHYLLADAVLILPDYRHNTIRP